MFLDVRRPVRGLNLLLVSTVLELNFSARGTVCWRAMQVHLTHCIVRVRFDTNPKRESISRSVILLCELLHAVNGMLTKYVCLLSGMLSVRFIVMIIIPICVRAQEHVVLKCLFMESRRW